MPEEQHRGQRPLRDRHRGRPAAVTDLHVRGRHQRIRQVLVPGVERLHPAQARGTRRLRQPAVADQPLELRQQAVGRRIREGAQLDAGRDAAERVADA